MKVVHSVTIAGAGAARTVIRGGGPVLTIGTFGAETEPTVFIDGVTITGGVTRTSPQSERFTGTDGVFALGGGIEVPTNATFDGGAQLHISNSVIRGNRVAPEATVPSGGAFGCPGGECPFAFAGGGGIDTWGDLTVVDTRIAGNQVGSASGLSDLASDVDGGGLLTHGGTLVMRRSTVSANAATAEGVNGRFAEGGGVRVDGTVVIDRSRVTRNLAALHGALPAEVDMAAIGGGIQFGDVEDTRISDSAFTANTVEMTNSVGNANAFSGGFNVSVFGAFSMVRSTLSDNRVRSATVGASIGDASADGGGGSPADTSYSQISGNTVRARSRAGDATVNDGGVLFVGRLTDSAVTENRITAIAPAGTASAYGGGMFVLPFTDDDGNPIGSTSTRLIRSELRRNSVSANGAESLAQGGGVFNGPTSFSDGGPLRVASSRITRNVASAADAAGGGVFTRQPTKVTDSLITNNAPDQCNGCAAPVARLALRAGGGRLAIARAGLHRVPHLPR